LHGPKDFDARGLDVIGITRRILRFAEPFCFRSDLSTEWDARWGRSQMTAIARALSRRLPGSQSDVETLKTIGMFCGAGLLVSLMLASYGLDLSPGFF
jgi:hypothetical protein